MEALSVATTVIVFAPGLRVMVLLQLAVLETDAVSPLARTPFTVTEAIPLSPRPASDAVPDMVTDDVVTVCPFVWLVIERFGPNSSNPPPQA